MINQSTTNDNKSPEPPLAHPRATPDGERAPERPYKPYAEKPALTEAPYKPYAEKPALTEPPYKPYTDKPAVPEPPYEPYKGI